MEKGSLSDVVDVVVKLKLAVKNDSKVADVWGGRQSAVVKSEAEVVGGVVVGCGADDDNVRFITVQLKIVSLHP